MGMIAGALASSAIQFGVSKLMNKGSKKSSAARGMLFDPSLLPEAATSSPVSLNAGGLGSTFADNGIGISTSPARQEAVRQLAESLRTGSNRLDVIRQEIKPGIGALTNARVNAIRDARSRAIGNLRENLARRRLSGSSFAQDALSRAEAEFGREEAAARAQSFLEEADISQRIIERQAQLDSEAFGTILNELNLQGNVGIQLTQLAQSTINENARLISEMRANNARLQFGNVNSDLDRQAEAASGSGEFIGSLAKPVADKAGEFVGGLFK